MVSHSGRYLVKMGLIEPNVRLILFNKHKHMIKGACCYRAYSTKQKVKRQYKTKKEVVQPPPEVAPEDVKATSEPKNIDESVKEIIVKSKKQKNSKANAVPSSETENKFPAMSKYLIQNMMDFPLHKPDDFSDDDINNLTPELLNKLPSVSTIINETRSAKEKFVLENWRKKMIAQLGEEEFYNLKRDPVKKARLKKVLPKNVQKSNKILSGQISRGYKFHSYLKKRLRGEDCDDDEITDSAKGCWESISNVISDVSDVRLVESSVYHPVLNYKGVVDCVALYRNEWHVIEWKVGKVMRKGYENTYMAPVQMCAYMGSLSWGKQMDSPEPVSKGLVVYAFPDGQPSQIFPINVDNSGIYWDRWLMRLQEFWATRSGTPRTPVTDDERDAGSES